ncbi:MAG: hypothetical protein PGN13_13800 [Patulibacter minatonensis]
MMRPDRSGAPVRLRSPEYWMQTVRPVRPDPWVRLCALLPVAATSAAEYLEREPQWFAVYFVLVAAAMWWASTHGAPSWAAFGQLGAAVLTVVLWRVGLPLIIAFLVSAPVHVVLFGTRLREARTFDPTRAQEWWGTPRRTPPSEPPRHVRWRA